MASKALVLALACLNGAQAANVLRGPAVKANVEPVSANDAPAQHGVFAGIVQKVEAIRQNPQAQQQEREGGDGWSTRIFLQILFGVIYYFLVLSKYPMLDGFKPTEEAQAIQKKNAVEALFDVSAHNLVLSWCCTGPRAAHTFHSTDILNYWPSLFLMSCFPCCTLAMVNGFTELNERLGGEKQNIFEALLCACCCSCCIVAQDAQTLDVITGMDTKLCGVEEHKAIPA